MDTNSIFNQDTKFIDLKALQRFLDNLNKNIVTREPGKGLSANDFSNENVSELKESLQHARSPHAPPNAQENTIERIYLNSLPLRIYNKTVDINLDEIINVPTKVSDLVNDLEFLRAHPNVNQFNTINTDINLTYGGVFQIVKNVQRDVFGHIQRVETDRLTMPQAYVHPTSSVSPGTYSSVTVNAQGHIIAGTNPTTRDGYGLTDVPTVNEMNLSIMNTISLQSGLKRTIVTILPEASAADPNTIYWVRRQDPTGEDNRFDEWFVIDGAWEKIGDTNPSLVGYIHEDNIREVTIAEIDTLFL